MKVITDSNETIDLGVTETSPTISITDYSRRVTDDFGVTTVVPRKFSRRLSVRMLLATGVVDAVQRRLAGLRATPARWIASDDLAWLAVRGFFKDFEIDVADPLNSFCTLSVEGLAESETVADNGVEPAPTGTSSLRLLQPVAVTGSNFVSSTVPENEYPAWASTTTYGKGARVIVSSTHRVYESLIAGNIGSDPTTTPTAWLDTGPTNRWAMFDEALGTVTLASGSLSVVLSGSATNAIALVDVTGASVRVQAAGYDRTQAAGAGAIVFADLPNVTGQITVTVTGSGAVAVGTLLIGRIVGLGITEASPTAGITDYSRKEVDDFGEVTVVQRAWAKRMSARALIRTDAVDQVANRIASVRARPCLWIADSALDSITLYGFFKDFSIEVGERVSKLSLSVEGLSKAAPVPVEAPGVATGLNPRGDYTATTTYSEGDVVQYQGSSWYYVAQDPSAGNPPPTLPTTENAYWRVLARAGDGTPGRDGASAFTLRDVTYTSTGPTSVTKVGGGEGWTAKARTLEGYNAAFVTAPLNPGQTLALTVDPDNGAGFDTQDYCWLFNDNGSIVIFRNGTAVWSGAAPAGGTQFSIIADSRTVRYIVAGGEPIAPHAPNTVGETLYGSFCIKSVGSTIGPITFGVPGKGGEDGKPGKDAPLLKVQWSIDGSTNWHDNYMGADVYQRQSSDGGLTYGPAYRVVGENGYVGADGTFVSFVFKRSATIPTAPTDNSGNPPTGWTDAPPAGTDFLWQSKATFRAATQLSSWSAPARISGEDGFILDTEHTEFLVPVFSNGASKPSWTGGQGTIKLTKGGTRQTAGVTYSLRSADKLASLTLSGDTFSFAGITGDSGTFVIQAFYNGQTYERTINIKKVYDGDAAFKGSSDFGNKTAGAGTTALGNAQTPVPASSTLRLSAVANYTPIGGVVGSFRGRLHLYWQNVTDNGPLNYLGPTDGSTATTVNQGTAQDPDYVSTPGTVSGAFEFAGFPTDKVIGFSATLERIAGNLSAAVTGNMRLESR